MILPLVLLVLGAASTLPPAPSEPLPIPAGYVPVTDATGVLVVAVPESWTDVDPQPAQRDGVVQPYVAASPDLATFLTSFDAPGVLYSAFPHAQDPLDLVRSHGLTGGCATLEVKAYDDPVFTGVVQVGTDCGTMHMTWNMVVASPADQSFTAVVQVQAPPDDEAVTIVRRTFNIVPDTAPTFGTVPTPAGSSVPP